MLTERIITAVVLLGILITLWFYLPQDYWSYVCVLGAFVAAREWTRLASFKPLTAWFFSIATVAVVAFLSRPAERLWSAHLPLDAGMLRYILFLTSSVFWIFLVPLLLRQPGKRLNIPALVLLGVVLIAAFALALEYIFSYSPWLLLAAMLPVWLADIAAYFAGRRFGKRKLAPTISPGKSWEGVYAAIFVVCCYFIVLTVSAVDKSGGLILLAIILGALFAGLSIIGDLFESMLKRQSGLKDSGNVLPGHGGLLDRTDSLLSSQPVLAAFMVFFEFPRWWSERF